MVLHPDLKGLCGALLHRSSLPSVSATVNELIADETCLMTMAHSTVLPSCVVAFVLLLRNRFQESQNRESHLSVGIWVEQIVPHRLDVGMVLGI